MKGIKEHYVPQFYLKNFGDRIYQYDKKTREVGRRTPRSVAFQRDFYVDSGNDDASKLEGWMSQFEGRASAVISAIVETESIAGLSDTDRTTLCDFVAFQFARTPEFREWRHDMVQSALDVLVRQLGVTGWHYAEKEENAGAIHLASMLAYVYWARPHLLQMGVCLLKNDTSMPLWTSDNPVVRYNDLTDKLGLKSPGVVFHLPLSPKILLRFYDGTHMVLLDDMAAAAGIPEKRRAWVCGNIPETVSMVAQNVIHANHLQARFSKQFVYSATQRFHMMKAFLDRDGDYKMRHVFHCPGGPDAAGNTENNLGMSGADGLKHNLQNALWWYREAKQATDTLQTFMHLCMSLEMVTGLGWDWDVDGKEFDDGVRRLTGNPALSLDKFRQAYDNIRRNGHPDPHMGMAQMAKDVEELRLIATKAIVGRIDELQADD